MKTKQEIKQWLLENCVNEYGDLDISELDFSDFDGDINLNHWVAKRNLYQHQQKVGGNLRQDYQKVQGVLCQDCQRVGEDLFQNCQEVCGDLYQGFQKVRGNLCYENDLEAFTNEELLVEVLRRIKVSEVEE